MKRGVEDIYHGRPSESVAKHHRVEQGRFSSLSPYIFERLEGLFAAGMKPDDLDDAAINALAGLAETDAASILDRIASIGPHEVRNKSAFVCDRAKRARDGSQRWRENGGAVDQINQQLSAAEADGVFGPSGLDARCRAALRRLPLPVQHELLDDFLGRDRSSIRNPNALLQSLISKRDPRNADGSSEGGAPHDHRRGEGRSRARGRGSGRGVEDSAWTGTQPSGAPGGPPGGVSFEQAPHEPFFNDPRHGPLVVTAESAAVMPAGQQGGGGRVHQGLAQLKWGVRVDEFLTLSPVAAYVHPAAALRLQQLWDEGNPLVSLMEDRSFDALANLDAKAAVDTIEQMVAKMPTLPMGDIASLNAAFMDIATPTLAMGVAVPIPMVPAAGAISNGPRVEGLGGRAAQLDAGMQMNAAPPPFSDHPLLRALAGDVQHKLAFLLNSSRGALEAKHFDKGVVERLLELSHAQQMQVIDDLLHDDVHSIRNPAAYINGIVRRYVIGAPSVRGGQGRHGGRPNRQY